MPYFTLYFVSSGFGFYKLFLPYMELQVYCYLWVKLIQQILISMQVELPTYIKYTENTAPHTIISVFEIAVTGFLKIV